MMQQTVPMDMNNAPQELPLRAIHLPAEPGFWPLAPGWWVVIVVVVLVLMFVVVKVYQRRKRLQQYLAIEEQLIAINHAFQTHKDKRQILSEMSMLLRRFEKFQQNKNQEAALTGSAWIEHLNSYHKDQPFTAYQSLLTDAIYMPNVDFDTKELSDLIQMHIKKVVMTVETRSAKKEAAHV